MINADRAAMLRAIEEADIVNRSSLIDPPGRLSAEIALTAIEPLITEREEALRADLDVARARIAELEAAQVWQPIETAPKDGGQVLLLRGQTVAVGYWSFTFEEWWPLINPDHWRPAPAPPEASGDEE